jgi:hypothetical protein
MEYVSREEWDAMRMKAKEIENKVRLIKKERDDLIEKELAKRPLFFQCNLCGKFVKMMGQLLHGRDRAYCDNCSKIFIESLLIKYPGEEERAYVSDYGSCSFDISETRIGGAVDALKANDLRFVDSKGTCLLRLVCLEDGFLFSFGSGLLITKKENNDFMLGSVYWDPDRSNPSDSDELL